MRKILEAIAASKSVALIGLGRGVGKTTTLNYLIRQYRDKLILGLTSTGVEGDDEKIYVAEGTFIATSHKCLAGSDITKEIIATTGIDTPLGPIIIVRALTGGYVKIAGPSVNSDLAVIRFGLERLGCDLVLIDSSLTRKTSAAADIAKGTIIVTGAALAPDMEQVAEITANMVAILSTNQVEDIEMIELYQKVLADCKLAFIYNNTIKRAQIQTVLGSSKEVVEHLNKDLRYIFIKGIVTDNFIDNIMKSTDQYKGKIFVVEDGTKIFLSHDMKHRFEKNGGIFQVIRPVNIIGISYNPVSGAGYAFNQDDFYHALKEKIDFPVFNVLDVEK